MIMNVILNVGAVQNGVFGINRPGGRNLRHLLAVSDQTGQGERERDDHRFDIQT